MAIQYNNASKVPWNKGKLVGQKKPLKLREIWEIRIRLQLKQCHRELAMFDLAIDSKLRSCDFISLKIRDVFLGTIIQSRAMILQQKTQTPVRFEIMPRTQGSVIDWVRLTGREPNDYLFPSCSNKKKHISSRQYSRIVKSWVSSIGLDTTAYGTHSMRRTKAAMIYKRTKNLRAVQLLLGHTKLESTVRYLGIDLDDALELAEKTEI
jgi:integrase